MQIQLVQSITFYFPFKWCARRESNPLLGGLEAPAWTFGFGRMYLLYEKKGFRRSLLVVSVATYFPTPTYRSSGC